MSFKKAKTIAKAIVSELPVNEKWYQDRLAICEACPYNSDNVPEDQRGLIHKTHELKCTTATLGVSSRFCTACTCCIELKCGSKTEECGRVKLIPPQPPLWNAIEVESAQRDGVTMENLSDTKLSLNGNEYLFDFGLTTEKTIECKFTVKRKGGLKILSVNPACGCTVPTINSFSNKAATLTVKISTVGFKEGINEKTLVIKYQDGNVIKDIHIRFRNIIQPTK